MRLISQALLFAVVLPALACAQDRAPAVAGGNSEAEGRAATAVPVDTLRVHYLANEGFMLESGHHRVLIDALFGQGIPGYDIVPAVVRDSLERGAQPWGGVAVALASHFHGDHFDPAAVSRFLESNPDAVFISTPQAAAAFAEANRDRPDLAARFRAVLPPPGAVERLDVAGIDIEVLNLHHGPGNPPTENLGLVISLGDRRVLHIGDTEAKKVDFEPYLARLEGIDVALLPFWFLSSDWRADMVRDRIRPGRIAVAHMPVPEAPAGYFARWKSYEELRTLIERRFPDAWIPSRHGDAMPWPSVSGTGRAPGGQLSRQ